ncbi:RhoGAP-domain-containing protein [Phanerochaete sordida]|uniref:RhoGAP-domain-containing protein n=1 Tax=Phanerochaete sordida TaxID=48140 RepID=A0A9P3GAT5_9APHY|nr:RhoGAP-domain-containing protein [Phanerochaete sordida]
MTNPMDQGRQEMYSVGSPPGQSALAYMSEELDGYRDHPQPSSIPKNGPMSAPPVNGNHILERPHFPTRASTVSSPHDLEHKKPKSADPPHARSEDLNHSTAGSSNDLYSTERSYSKQGFLSASRPSTPAGSNNHTHASSSDHSDSYRRRPPSVASDRSGQSESLPNEAEVTNAATSTNHSMTSTTIASSTCTACGKAMAGAFVRALGAVYHLNCFTCMDCGAVVASKFFPIDGPDGKQHPLCERDYFRRLNLICAKCGQALRGSYITACNKKFHVDHFTCSVCPTLFGPQDSYYEHEGDVYCHYHYSTRFATKCAGCNSAILKQFVEINRNMRDECWHPECYMINKFWNVKVNVRRPNSLLPSSESVDQPPPEQPWIEEEKRETPTSLKDKQIRMEQQVYRIWTVLSAFEESSAACISDMLRQVSNGQYLEAIRMAEKFILHVEVLFATIDDLEYQFARLNLKGMSHVREARMLCRKTVDLFTLLSHTQETGARRMGMTQELLALVTGLAHYLKILIRIALTGALKLEREQDVREALSLFLDKLHMLAIQGGNPSAKRMMKRVNGEILAPGDQGNLGTQGVTYGFKSLAPENAGESPFAVGPRDPSLAKVPVINPPSDLCVKCNQTVEEDCARLGTYQRWHSHCLQCSTCGRAAAVPVPKENAPKPITDGTNLDDREKEKAEGSSAPKLSSARRPPANVKVFAYDPDSMKDTQQFGPVPTVIFCTDHAHPNCRASFQAVSRLEQYAFLLNVALRRLYVLLKKRGVVPATPSAPSPREAGQDPYSDDINRLKSVHLDRKLSATARVPKRSTIVESPTGKVAHASDLVHRERDVTHSRGPQQQHPRLQKAPQHGMSGSRTPIDASVIRPAFARNNTEVMIVDESAPTSPAGGVDEPKLPGAEEGITLADIPQLVEAAQAREQHRSLPSQSSIPYIAELSPVELAIVKHAAVLALQRSSLRDIFDLDEILELVEMKKSSFWNKLFKQGPEKKNVKKKGVFGVPLELLVEREGADSLHGASRATLRVPSFVDDVVSAMRQMDMSVEGIFRKNGNIRRLKELTDAIDRDPSSVDLTQDNPVQLAALLKKFLRELPDPLLTFKLHRLFIATQNLTNEAERKRMLHMVSLILPKYHRDTMEVLFVFLKWVASFAHLDEETGSKMDLPNLATVICPSILYSRGRDGVRDESFGAIRVVTALLENQDEFFCVPEEFLPILHDQDYFQSSMELPSKDFLKKCDTYYKQFNFNTAQRSDDSRGPPPRAESRTLQTNSERTLVGSPSPSDHYPPTRSGLQSRQQSPPSLQHSPYSYPPASGPQPSLSQSAASIQAPQPRAAQGGYPSDNGSNEWPPPQMPASRPPSRPSSSYVPSRSSGEGNHPFTSNSHAAQAVRQRV